MTEFRLNLIRDRVPDVRRRRARYRGMLIYLGVVGLVLVFVLGGATARLVRAAGLRAEIRDLERTFRAEAGQEGGIRARALELEDELARRYVTLQAVDRRLAASVRAAAVLRELALSLPAGVSLRSLQVNEREGTLSLDLLVQGLAVEETTGPSDLLARWQDNMVLAAPLKHLAYQGSQLESPGQQSDVVWRFSGRLSRGGG
jgi:hypothetical protein